MAIGVGASLDFLAGAARRAPAWMQHSGTEWLWRLANEPGRLWRRYATDARRLAPALARSWLLMRQADRPAPAGAAAGGVLRAGPAILAVRGGLGAGQRTAFEAAAMESLRAEAPLRVDLRECTRIDSAGLGCLASLAHEARSLGRELRIYPGSAPMGRMLRQGGLDACLGAPGDLEARP